MIILRVDEFYSKQIVDNRNNNLKYNVNNYQDIYLKKNINKQTSSIYFSSKIFQKKYPIQNNIRTQKTEMIDKKKYKKSENYKNGKSIEILINKNYS
jgi:hypothetical protein